VYELFHGDCMEVMATLAESSVDAIVTDPPYSISFMAKKWDSALPGLGHWQAALRVLKPGGYMFAFGGSRTSHRLACAVEDAGFEIRDCVMWLHGQGFPKGKGCLKPAYEPILLCRKPGPRVLPLGIDEGRVPHNEPYKTTQRKFTSGQLNRSVNDGRDMNKWEESHNGAGIDAAASASPSGRYPANIVHDGSDEVLEAFAEFGEKNRSSIGSGVGQPHEFIAGEATFRQKQPKWHDFGDNGTTARFFYCAKASRSERTPTGGGNGVSVKNTHPT